MERARRRVEAVAPVAPGTAVPGAAEPESGEGGRERGFVSLRLWQNSVRERVKRNYSFPGTFPPGLRARVRIAVDRGGTFLSAELVESSGNGRFDNLVCLAAVRNTRYPPLPKAVEEDTHTFFLTCTP
jgi:TonB family protein